MTSRLSVDRNYARSTRESVGEANNSYGHDSTEKRPSTNGFEVQMSKHEEGLTAVHVCQACGAVIKRAGVEPDSIITGLIKCPSCGHEGDLNIEIRGTST